MNNIIVVGSSSIDLVVNTNKIPNAGETVLGESFFTTPGGKGANQAVAAARLSAEVYMIGAVGNDAYGTQIINNLKDNNVNTDYMDTIENVQSGTAHITLYEEDNRIIVVPGANNHIKPDTVIPKLAKFNSGDIIILQQEIPSDTVDAVVKYAQDNNLKVILNPAPYRALSQETIDRVTYLTPNESESELLFGEDLDNVIANYPNKLIVTRGDQGAVYFDTTIRNIAGHKQKVVDTTGAGDTFNGALAVALIEKMELAKAIDFANMAGSLSVTQLGAQGAMPYRQDLDV
jgi:ribokinase